MWVLRLLHRFISTFHPDTRKSGRSIVINTMPATGLSISCAINGIIMSMYRNTRSGMDTKAADMAITVPVGTTAMARARARARATVKATTKTKQDQISYYCPGSYHPADAIKDARWMETLIDKEEPLPALFTTRSLYMSHHNSIWVFQEYLRF
jgi:cell division protein FtsX